MKQDNYLIEYKDIKDNSIQDFLDLLKNTKGIRLSELKVINLSYHNGIPIYPGKGVYIFRNEANEIKLVGKGSSMSFAERIPKHFDLRPGAWFNRLLELVIEKEDALKVFNKGKTEKAFLTASKYVFENYNVVLIHYKGEDFEEGRKKRINTLETLLRSCTNTMNKFKSKRINDLNRTVEKK